MTAKNDMANTADREILLSRIINAPREMVFKMWIDPKHLAQWWGPDGFTNPVCEVDPRPGGPLRIDMRGPDGTVFPMKGVFHEIDAPERLVFTSSAHEDENGNPQLEVLNTVTFANQGGKTKLTVKAVVVKSVPAAAPAIAGMEKGWGESLERLAEHAARA